MCATGRCNDDGDDDDDDDDDDALFDYKRVIVSNQSEAIATYIHHTVL